MYMLYWGCNYFQIELILFHIMGGFSIDITEYEYEFAHVPRSNLTHQLRVSLPPHSFCMQQLWYERFRKDLESIGFNFNVYDSCVANRIVNEKQHTISFASMIYYQAMLIQA